MERKERKMTRSFDEIRTAFAAERYGVNYDQAPDLSEAFIDVYDAFETMASWGDETARKAVADRMNMATDLVKIIVMQIMFAKHVGEVSDEELERILDDKGYNVTFTLDKCLAIADVVLMVLARLSTQELKDEAHKS